MTAAPARLCPITGQPITPDRYAAPAAAGQLRATLAGLPDLMVELETTITRQVRMGAATGCGSDTRLPYNPEASDRAWTLRMTLLMWVDELAQTRREPIPQTWTAIANTLTAWSDWLTTTPQGAQAIDEILDAHHHALKAIDRPADRTYAGPCPTCTGDVYGTPGATTVRCTTCGTERDLAEARQAMLDKLAVMHLPAADAARALTLLTGREVTADRIRQWRKRGHITSTGNNTAGQPLYDLKALAALATPERITA